VAAAAVIFLPDILDGEKQSHKAQFEEIPKAPTFTAGQVNENFPEQKIAEHRKKVVHQEIALDDELIVEAQESNVASDTVEVATIAKPSTFEQSNEQVKKLENFESKVATAKKENQKPPEATKAAAWVIQLGSFRHQKNVDALMKKLEKNGYLAYTRPINTSSGTLIKVFVGPDTDKSALTKKLPQLKKLTGSSGKLIGYSPARK
jgi:DedD protein